MDRDQWGIFGNSRSGVLSFPAVNNVATLRKADQGS